MDFKKIEWIFFVAFLGLNVFLFSSYHDAVYQENNVIRSNQTESIQQRLASDDITYTGKISSENKQGYYLSAEQTNLSTSLANYRKAGKSGLLASGVFLVPWKIFYLTKTIFYSVMIMCTRKTFLI